MRVEMDSRLSCGVRTMDSLPRMNAQKRNPTDPYADHSDMQATSADCCHSCTCAATRSKGVRRSCEEDCLLW
jgi:hypothetical protein